MVCIQQYQKDRRTESSIINPLWYETFLYFPDPNGTIYVPTTIAGKLQSDEDSQKPNKTPIIHGIIFFLRR
jgi:hypothetical protein